MSKPLVAAEEQNDGRRSHQCLQRLCHFVHGLHAILRTLGDHAAVQILQRFWNIPTNGT